MTNKHFPWGTVTKVHQIPGLKDIVEYVVNEAFEDAGRTNFQVESKTFGTVSYGTFDEALMATLCDKYGNLETMPYVWRLLGDKPTADKETDHDQD